jgi:hypothetical protein
VILSVLACFLILPAAEAKEEKKEASYYCLVKDSEGATKLEILPEKAAAQVQKDNYQQYREAGKDWAAEKKDWESNKARGRYPVPPPVAPSLKKLFRLSDNAERDKARKKSYQAKLEGVNVCIITDHTGAQSVEIVERTGMRARKVEIIRAYAAALKDAADPVAERKKLSTPNIRVVGRPRDKEQAEKIRERAQKQLDRHLEKQASRDAAE